VIKSRICNELDDIMEIQVSETPPCFSTIKVEPKEEECEDLLPSAFLLDPPPVKTENEENINEYGTLSEDLNVNIEKIKSEKFEDSKEWVNKSLIKTEKNDKTADSKDQDDNFIEDSIIKSEEMHIKEDTSINEPGTSSTYRVQQHKQTNPTEFVRTTQPVFMCQECGYTTFRKGDITRHLRCQHQNSDNVTKFKCPKCDYTSIWKYNTKKHLRTHDNDNSHKCNETLRKSVERYYASYAGRI